MESPMKLLLVEDDATTAAYVAKGLREEGHVVDHLTDGREALAQAMRGGYDVLIVDRMLPGLDGLSLVRALRSAKVTAPAIFLTAMGGVDDRIEGLRAGGDDYLVKPFAFGELSARIDVLGRRAAQPVVETVLKAGDLRMDLIARKVTRGGETIDLLPREFALLEHLLRRKGRVQTHVSRLRAKVDKPFGRELIRTVRGAGYKIEG